MSIETSSKLEISTTVTNILNIIAIGYYICLVAIGVLIILMLIKKFTSKPQIDIYGKEIPTDDNATVINLYKWTTALYAIAMCITTGFIIARKKIPGSNVLNIITSIAIVVITFFVN